MELQTAQNVSRPPHRQLQNFTTRTNTADGSNKRWTPWDETLYLGNVPPARPWRDLLTATQAAVPSVPTRCQQVSFSGNDQRAYLGIYLGIWPSASVTEEIRRIQFTSGKEYMVLVQPSCFLCATSEPKMPEKYQMWPKSRLFVLIVSSLFMKCLVGLNRESERIT